MEEEVDVIGVELGEDGSALGVEFDETFDDIGLSLSESVSRRFLLTGAYDISFNNILCSLLISLTLVLWNNTFVELLLPTSTISPVTV